MPEVVTVCSRLRVREQDGQYHKGGRSQHAQSLGCWSPQPDSRGEFDAVALLRAVAGLAELGRNLFGALGEVAHARLDADDATARVAGRAGRARLIGITQLEHFPS